MLEQLEQGRGCAAPPRLVAGCSLTHREDFLSQKHRIRQTPDPALGQDAHIRTQLHGLSLPGTVTWRASLPPFLPWASFPSCPFLSEGALVQGQFLTTFALR